MKSILAAECKHSVKRLEYRHFFLYNLNSTTKAINAFESITILRYRKGTEK